MRTAFRSLSSNSIEYKAELLHQLRGFYLLKAAVWLHPQYIEYTAFHFHVYSRGKSMTVHDALKLISYAG
jgi:hypothetical protein